MKRFIAQAALPLIALTALTTLAGCGGGADTLNAPMFCPQVAVLQQASTLTQFLPGRTDVAAQITTAQVTGVAGACTLNQAKKLLVVSFRAGFSASNGPANQENALNLPYFVAITQDDNIISKTDYSIQLAFNGNASTAQATSKPIKVELSNDHASGHVQILVGFELTPDELSYAQAHPAVGP